MDEIMYEKLRAETHQRISYRLTSLTLLENQPELPTRLLARAIGDLVVAGRTNAISMPVTILVAAAGKVQFSGSVGVKMTEFGIDPPNPSFGGGAIKTGDAVKLTFSWWVNRIGTLHAEK